MTTKLAYLARQAVKRGDADSMWTTDGRVIIKKTSDSRPHCVGTPTDVEYMEIIPLLATNSDETTY